MTNEPEGGPIIDFDAEPTPEEEKAAVLEQLRVAMEPPTAVPTDALNLLLRDGLPM